MSDLLETLKRVVLENSGRIGCPEEYGLHRETSCLVVFYDHCKEHNACWQAAITQEGVEADGPQLP